MPEPPHATKTLPFGSNVWVWPKWTVFRLEVRVHVSSAGSYNSAVESPLPPTTSTLPLVSRVAVGLKRAIFRLPVMLHVPVRGSYNSALLRLGLGQLFWTQVLLPPATRTLPFGSSVAV